MPSARITQGQIAAATGVSNYVVSHALRDSTKVALQTRQRVQRVARQMGYRTNTSARVTRTGRHYAIALLQSAWQHRSYLPQALVHAMHGESIRHQTQFTIGMLPDEELTDAGFVPRILNEWSADGLLINYISKIPERMVELIGQHVIPAIWLNTKRNSDCVYPDDHAAGRTLAEHLLGCGARRIAFVQLVSPDHYSVRDRRRGVADAVHAAGLELMRLDPRYDRHVEHHQWPEICTALLDRPDRPDAIISYTHAALTPLLLTAQRLGIDVPSQLRLATFGEGAVTTLGYPICTVTLPEPQMGRTAVQMLLQKIDKPEEPLAPVVLPCTLKTQPDPISRP
jgi:DNA-binding LacI/PurR family transcriptional regulator